MRTLRLAAALALFAGCGGNDDPKNPSGDRFDEFINVSIPATGDFTGLPVGDNTWEGTPWLTQTIEPSNVIDVTANGLVEDFQDEFPVPAATVDLWYDDVVDATNDAQSLSDNNGLITIDAVACQKMAYRVTTDFSLTPTKTTYKAHHIYPPEPDGTVDEALFVSVSDTTYQLIPTIVGVTIDPALAVIAGTAYDVVRDAAISSAIDTGKIEGAQVIVYDENGEIPDTLSVNYFTDEFPDRDQKWTSADGLWVAANVPAGNLRIEMWGQVNGELTLLGATSLFSEADSINISNVFAGYGDGVKYPYACEEAMSGTTR